MNPADLADRVLDGDLRLHELEDHTDPETAATARRLLLERETDVPFTATGKYVFDARDADSNIENLIGAVQIPLGVVGPVTVDGAVASGDYYLPLATTEGALLASVNRGCSLIRRAGGATARVTDAKMTRAPVFKVTDAAEGNTVIDWIRTNTAALVTAAEETTAHGEVIDITPYLIGDSVFVRFAYDTKDAIGMNMATIATRAASDVIEQHTPASLVALSGNVCTDKKPAAINAILGRGRTVTADIRIDTATVTDFLHATPTAIADLNTRKNHIGSAKAVSLGHNAQTANVVAAMFLATGQDAAQVVEGANAITRIDARDDELYAGITIASLEIGTVGGGTGLATQREALDLLGVRGGGSPPGSNADGLAELIAVGALAGELSLLGALASRHLSSAHEELGR